MAELTNEEVELVDQFRKRFDDNVLNDDEHRSDQFLIRWVRARSGNLDAAEKMLQESFRWRKEHDLSSALTQEFPPILHQLAAYHIGGRDRQGRLVVEVAFGKWDIKKIVSTLGETEFFNYTNKFFEEIIFEIAKCRGGEKSMAKTQIAVFIDFSGYSYSQLLNVRGVQSTITMAGKYEAYYPEILGVGVVINAPAVFSMFYSLVKPLLPVETVAKLQIYGTDRSTWEPVIDALVEKDQVGVAYGGTRPPPETPTTPVSTTPA